MNLSKYLDYVGDEWARGWLQRGNAEDRGTWVPNSYMEMLDGNPYDAMVFSQVMYWHGIDGDRLRPRIQHHYNGHFWVVKTYKEWQDDLKFKSERTVRRSFKRLVELGVIIKETHKSPYHNGQVALFVRVNWLRFRDLMDGSLSKKSDPESPKRPVQNGLEGQSEADLKDDSLPESTTETTTNIGNRHAAVDGIFDFTGQLTGSPTDSEPEEPEATNFDADHPLVKALVKFNIYQKLPQKTIRLLEKPILITHIDGSYTSYPSLLTCYDNYPGFPDFVEERISQFYEMEGSSVEIVVRNLRNFDKNNNSSFCGWLAWKEKNKRFINQDATNEKAEREAAGAEWIWD